MLERDARALADELLALARRAVGPVVLAVARDRDSLPRSDSRHAFPPSSRWSSRGEPPAFATRATIRSVTATHSARERPCRHPLDLHQQGAHDRLGGCAAAAHAD